MDLHWGFIYWVTGYIQVLEELAFGYIVLEGMNFQSAQRGIQHWGCYGLSVNGCDWLKHRGFLHLFTRRILVSRNNILM